MNILELAERKRRGNKFSMVTCYDFSSLVSGGLISEVKNIGEAEVA